MTFLNKNVVIIIVLVAFAETAYGRSKPSAQVHLENKYDQKQLGDYNVHVHLNDLKVVAIVGARGSGGDFDYNYDYSDFTVKPSDVDITLKPPQPSNNSSDEKPTPGPSSSSTNSNSVTESKPILFTTKQPPVTNEEAATTQKEELIKVTEQVLINKLRKTESSTEKKNNESAITNISIVVAENNERSGKPIPRGHSAVRYKKCGQGYSRDKQGRCRKIRRNSSYVPLSISRLASNLVKKLKYHISRKS